MKILCIFFIFSCCYLRRPHRNNSNGFGAFGRRSKKKMYTPSHSRHQLPVSPFCPIISYIYSFIFLKRLLLGIFLDAQTEWPHWLDEPSNWTSLIGNRCNFQAGRMIKGTAWEETLAGKLRFQWKCARCLFVNYTVPLVCGTLMDVYKLGPVLSFTWSWSGNALKQLE